MGALLVVIQEILSQAVVIRCKFRIGERPLLADWVENPDEAITLMPGAVNRFGLMPKLSYKNEDVKKIAEYIYDTEFNVPEWYRQHYKQMHGTEPSH